MKCGNLLPHPEHDWSIVLKSERHESWCPGVPGPVDDDNSD